MENLTNRNAFAYAMQIYRNPSCAGVHEFQSDFVRIKYVKRILGKYQRTQEFPLRLYLNHVIGLYNVFEPVGLTRLLFCRIPPDMWPALKTTLEFLSFMPATLPPINGRAVINTSIPTDEYLWRMLRETL